MNLDTVTSAFSGIPTDWLIIGAFAIFAAFEAFRGGAQRVSQIALALPIASLLFESISKTAILGGVLEQFSTPLIGTIVFFALVALIYVFIGRIGLSWGGGESGAMRAALAGVALTALVLIFWIQIPTPDSLWQFGPQVQTIFAESYRFWWLLASYAALAFVRS